MTEDRHSRKFDEMRSAFVKANGAASKQSLNFNLIPFRISRYEINRELMMRVP